MTLLLTGCLLAAAGPAQAIYIVTPLNIDPSSAEADVGDELAFTLTPNEDHEGTSYAGQTVTVRYSFDPEEGQHQYNGSGEDPDDSTSSDDQTAEDERADHEDTSVTRDVTQVTLDDASRGSFVWTVPEEVDDRNVFVNVVADDDTILASAHVRVGDAEEMAFIMNENIPDSARSGPSDGEPAVDDAQPDQDGDGGNSVPAPGILAAIAGIGAVALALRRARS